MCKKIKALEKQGFFFNYSWGSLLLVTSTLIQAPTSHLSCAIGIDGFNTLINNFIRLASLYSFFRSTVFCSMCTLNTVTEQSFKIA